MDMFTSYGHIKKPKKSSIFLMILAWDCPFKQLKVPYLLLWHYIVMLDIMLSTQTLVTDMSLCMIYHYLMSVACYQVLKCRHWSDKLMSF